MSDEIAVLHVEDSEEDGALVRRELSRIGQPLSYRRVETEEEMREALSERTWCVVLADYRLPAFSAPAALALLQSVDPDAPFIVVSGFIGEEIAVQMMRAGARDYLMKDNLARLAPTVERETREAAARRQKRRAEEALRESEVRYRLLAENSGDIVWTVSVPSLRFTFVSPSVHHLLGYSASELLTRTLTDIVHIDARARVLSLLHERMREDITQGAAVRTRIDSVELVRSDGSPVVTEMLVMSREPGSDIGRELIGVTRDITERTLLEKQLVHAQKMEAVGQLAGGIAHDFNNLLQAILGFTQLARDSLPEGSEQRENLDEVLRASERARMLVGKLLTFARRERMSRSAVDLDELVGGMTEMLRRAVGESYELKTVSDGRGKLVKADPGQLEQALVNLCINAKDAMTDGGVIRIETGTAELDTGFCRRNPWARPGRWAVLTVADTGAGMSAEVLNHLFEPFYTTKPRGRGTGLGAAIVYGIVTQHEGLIHVRSAPDKGTSVAIYLPLVAAAAAPREAAAPVSVAVNGTETILLAEDDDSVRGFAVQVLREAGYTVLPARDGAEAVEVFETRGDTVALAVLDVVMPKASGKAVAERIRVMRPGLPVLFCTGYDFRLLEEGFAGAASVGVLRKPFTHIDLLRRVRDIIDAGSKGDP